MREYDDDLMSYEEEAEDLYDDYNDYDEEYEEDEFFPEEDEGFMEGEEDYDDFIPYEDELYDNFQLTSVGRIDPNDRTITVVVKNTGSADSEAVVFGGNEQATLADGVVIAVEESSHREVQEESKSNPFKISGMKMSVSDELQFDHVLNITRKTATGSRTARVYQPRNATSPQNFSGKMIDDSAFEMDVTGQDSLRFTIRAGATAVFTFTIRARANVGNILRGGNVAEMSSAPRTTGLPQIDLLRKRRSRRSSGVARRRPARGRVSSSRKRRRPNQSRTRSNQGSGLRRRRR